MVDKGEKKINILSLPTPMQFMRCLYSTLRIFIFFTYDQFIIHPKIFSLRGWKGVSAATFDILNPALKKLGLGYYQNQRS